MAENLQIPFDVVKIEAAADLRGSFNKLQILLASLQTLVEDYTNPSKICNDLVKMLLRHCKIILILSESQNASVIS